MSTVQLLKASEKCKHTGEHFEKAKDKIGHFFTGCKRDFESEYEFKYFENCKGRSDTDSEKCEDVKSIVKSIVRC